MKNLTLPNITIFVLTAAVIIAMVIATIEVLNGNFHSTIAL